MSMEILPNGFTLAVPKDGFPLSTDSMVLAHFARLPRRARVLDLGSGCGTLGLLLCSSDPGCQVVGVEMEERAHVAALENIRRNGLDSRMESICADLRSLPREFQGHFDCCISNPPYFSGGAASRAHPAARREDTCTLAQLMASAAGALKFGGDFFLVHRPERLGELIALGAGCGLEAKRLCLVRHREGDGVSLILLSLRKGAKPGLKWEALTLRTSDGAPTEVYREIYHIQEN